MAASPTPDRRSQLVRGVLDLCLLAVIAEEPAYGYEMVRRLEERHLSGVAEGSMYPLLSRMERRGFVAGYRRPSPEGPDRKYYRLTQAGLAELRRGAAEWRELAAGVDRILKEVA